jgi:hypothetical protein
MLTSAVNPPSGLDSAALTERLRNLELEARRVEADLAAVISDGQRRGEYGDDSHTSMKGWLKANVNWSNSQVFRRRRLARLVEAYPTVGESLREGHIGVAQADELARVYANPRCRDQFDESIELLLVQAEQLEFDQARLCLKRWESFADADGAHNDREASKAGRTATVGELDGSLFLKATGGTAEDAAEIVAIFNVELETQFQLDVAERTRLHGPDAPASMLPRSDAQRRFDALQAIFRRSVSVPADAKPPKPLVNIIIDQRSFEENLHSHGLGVDPVDLPYVDPSLRRSETSTGIAVLPDVAVIASLTGHVRRVVVDTAGVVINMGRKQRLFTGSAREAAKLMAFRCDFRGCDVPVTFAEVDHLAEWQDHGGKTDIDNSAIDCKHHNRAKHRNKYRAERRPDGQVIYHRPDGTPILPVGQQPPPETEEQIQLRRIKQRVNALCEIRKARDKQLDARTADL